MEHSEYLANLKLATKKPSWQEPSRTRQVYRPKPAPKNVIVRALLKIWHRLDAA